MRFSLTLMVTEYQNVTKFEDDMISFRKVMIVSIFVVFYKF